MANTSYKKPPTVALNRTNDSANRRNRFYRQISSEGNGQKVSKYHMQLEVSIIAVAIAISSLDLHKPQPTTIVSLFQLIRAVDNEIGGRRCILIKPRDRVGR